MPSGCSRGSAVAVAAVKGGEDAFFVLENDLGVFDGVGGWGALGCDPGIFTRGFAEAVASKSIVRSAMSHPVCPSWCNVVLPLLN